MKYLHLDKQFSPFGKSIQYEAFTFNGGEPHIKILEELDEEEAITITIRISNFNDLGFLLMATDALKRLSIQNIQLLLPYFPGGRQDRVMVKGEPLSVKVYAAIINAQNYDKVTIFDPHSDVTGALLNNVQVAHNHAFVGEALKNIDDYLLVAPDGGALKKVYSLSQFLGGKPVVECSKQRNVLTGKLTGFKVYSNHLNGKTCVIVDDICDGGGTFIGLAKELKMKGAGELILVVSHGIFSKGFEALAQYFSKIYTTDAFSTIHHPSLIQIPLEHGLLFESSEHLQPLVERV